MCWGPAAAYGIPNKGKILEGWDADLTLVDLNTVKTVRDEDMTTKARWSPFAGPRAHRLAAGDDRERTGGVRPRRYPREACSANPCASTKAEP